MAKRAARRKEPEPEPEAQAQAQAEPESPNESAKPEASVEALEPEAEVRAEPQAPDETPKPEPEQSESPDEPAEPEPQLLWGYRCINCNQNSQPIAATEDGYHCPVCGHDWTDEHEQAPFRRVQRGER